MSVSVWRGQLALAGLQIAKVACPKVLPKAVPGSPAGLVRDLARVLHQRPLHRFSPDIRAIAFAAAIIAMKSPQNTPKLASTAASHSRAPNVQAPVGIWRCCARLPEQDSNLQRIGNST